MSNKNIKQDFAQKLQKEMLARGWNQSELARRSGMGRDNISGYLGGKVLPGSKHLKKIADAFGKEPGYFIEGVVLKEEPDRPMLDFKQNDDGTVTLRFVQMMPMNLAMKIIEMLKNINGKG